MPQPDEKPDTDLTTDEAIHKLFPDEVIEYAQEIAHEHDLPEDSETDDSIPEA